MGAHELFGDGFGQWKHRARPINSDGARQRTVAGQLGAALAAPGYDHKQARNQGGNRQTIR
jgi:hypothetical protein